MEVVSIPASHKRERIIINMLDDDRVHIQVFKLSSKGKLRDLYFDRIFKDSETNEIRIYAMGSNDEINVTGTGLPNIQLRIIGGSGMDTFTDANPSTSRNIIFYDTEINSSVIDSKTSFHLSNDTDINQYDYNREYKWNSTTFGFFFAYNNNDGLFLGGGPRFTKI